MLNLKSHLGPIESESAFWSGPQVIYIYSNFWEALVETTQLKQREEASYFFVLLQLQLLFTQQIFIDLY